MSKQMLVSLANGHLGVVDMRRLWVGTVELHNLHLALVEVFEGGGAQVEAAKIIARNRLGNGIEAGLQLFVDQVIGIQKGSAARVVADFDKSQYLPLGRHLLQARAIKLQQGSAVVLCALIALKKHFQSACAIALYAEKLFLHERRNTALGFLGQAVVHDPKLQGKL